MKAAVFHEPFNITTEDVEKPEPGDGEILLKVKACGICGSDLHMYKLDLFTEKLCRQTEKGGIAGHEMSGDIVGIGSGVEGFNVGDRVSAITASGGFAEFNTAMVIPGVTVIKLPDEVSYEEAATLEPLVNSLHATLKGSPAQGENVVVFGAGIIGLGIIQCLRALDLDLNAIVAVDVSDSRLAMAQKLGADHLVNAARTDPEEKIREILGWTPLMFYSDESSALVDVVYDCVGYLRERAEPPVIQVAMNLVKEFTGRVVVHGLFEADVSLDLSPMVLKQVDVLGSFAFFPEEVPQAMELIRTGKVDRTKIISHEYPLDQAREAFDMQCNVEESVKVLIKP